MAGTPTPNFGLPQYDDSDTAALDVLLNGITSTLDGSLKAALDESTDTTRDDFMALVGMRPMKPTSVTGGTIAGVAASFSGAGSVSVNGVFESGFPLYRVLINLTSVSPSGTPNLRMRTGGADDTSANYWFQRAWSNSGSALATAATASTTAVSLAGVSGTMHTLDLTFANPGAGTDTIITGQSTSIGGSPTSPGWTSLSGRVATSTPYTGLTVYIPSGSMSGTVRVLAYS